MTDFVSDIARAVLYEGYLLWPYRRSALKNRQRWTFGGVYPPAEALAASGDAATMATECLLEGDGDTRVDVELRFLHVVRRDVARLAGARRILVDALEIDGARYLSWDEATEREIRVPGIAIAALLGEVRRVPFAIEAGDDEEALRDRHGNVAGVVVRRWCAIEGTIEVSATSVAEGVHRLRVGVANSTGWSGDARADAQRHALLSTHVVLRAAGGAFVSMTDPPGALVDHARDCRNVGYWPVLVGEEGSRDTVLAAPMILPDYPRIAPESPGDLFDGGEIDQLLILNVLALTDQEQQEVRASDPRGREILDRCSTLSPEQRARLHGAIRELRPIASPDHEGKHA